MHFPLTTSLLNTANLLLLPLLTSATPITPHPLQTTQPKNITIKDFTVQIIREDFAIAGGFTISTDGSSNITCGPLSFNAHLTACDGGEDGWAFLMLADGAGMANLSVVEEVGESSGGVFSGPSITGNTFIPLYCMGVPDPPSGVETENCFALAEVEEGGAPITMTLE